MSKCFSILFRKIIKQKGFTLVMKFNQELELTDKNFRLSKLEKKKKDRVKKVFFMQN